MKMVEAAVELNYILATKTQSEISAFTLGNEMVDIGLLDESTHGFWIWDIKRGIEFYSPRFRRELGYQGEEDFPSVPESWMKAIDPEDLKIAIAVYEAHRNNPDVPYYIPCTYTRKDGTKLHLICAGKIVNPGEEYEFMIGTHEKELRI